MKFEQGSFDKARKMLQGAITLPEAYLFNRIKERKLGSGLVNNVDPALKDPVSDLKRIDIYSAPQITYLKNVGL